MRLMSEINLNELISRQTTRSSTIWSSAYFIDQFYAIDILYHSFVYVYDFH